MTLFIAAVVLPILFFLFSVSLDAGKYYTESAKTQRVLDEAATYAHRFLPYQGEAVAAARSLLGEYGSLASHTTITVDGDSISLSYEGNAALVFGGFFGLTLDVPVTAYARARGTPFDAFVALDASAYLGPALNAGAGWGSPLSFPAADFFRTMFQVEEQGIPIDDRVLTQQCFNEPFLALKRAAISSFEYLAGYSRNAVGLAVYPGVGSSLDVLREVGDADTHSFGPGEAGFQYYVDEHNRNELCAAAAEHERSFSGYQFPGPNPRLESGSVPPNQPAQLTLPDSTQNTWYLNPDFLPYLRTRHSVWSLARREQAIGDTAEVLREARAQVMGAAYLQNRGGLAGAPLKAIFLFAGDVPHAAGARFPDGGSAAMLQAQLAALRGDLEAAPEALRLRIFFILTRHPGNDSADFQDRVNAFAQFLQNEEGALGPGDPDRLHLQLVYADAPAQLGNALVGPMLLSGRTAVLSR